MNALEYIFEYLIVFPILVFIWFGIFSTFMFFLAKDLPVATILLMSMALVATIRITSYYKEDLSKDLGKMIPFALLAIFLVAPNFFSMELVQERFSEVSSFVSDILNLLRFRHSEICSFRSDSRVDLEDSVSGQKESGRRRKKSKNEKVVQPAFSIRRDL